MKETGRKSGKGKIERKKLVQEEKCRSKETSGKRETGKVEGKKLVVNEKV